MELKTNDYRIWYDAENTTVNFQGVLREVGIAEYQPLELFFKNILVNPPTLLTMNLKELEFLNSSGMTVVSQFVIAVRKKQTIELVVQASQDIPWQNKTLINWKRLMPSLTLIIN